MNHATGGLRTGSASPEIHGPPRGRAWPSGLAHEDEGRERADLDLVLAGTAARPVAAAVAAVVASTFAVAAAGMAAAAAAAAAVAAVAAARLAAPGNGPAGSVNVLMAGGSLTALHRGFADGGADMRATG
jgi:hypothetical protein